MNNYNNRYVGYGCVISNTKKDPTQSSVYKALQSLGIDDIYVDTVLVSTKKRPVLERLISELEPHDRIYMSDISDLLSGANKAREYYKQILDKGIELFIADLSKTFFHINPLSTVRKDLVPVVNSPLPLKLDTEEMLKRFDEFVSNYTATERRGRQKCYVNDFPNEWKELYFEYEGYRIDLQTLLERAKQFNIFNYPTLVKKFADYEQSLDYFDDTIEYYQHDPDFIHTPKRLVKREKNKIVFPEEYLIIKEHLERDNEQVDYKINGMSETYITQTGYQYCFFINDVIYQRYSNLETMKIPRKTRDISISKVFI